MPDNPLKSLTHYSRFIAELLNRPTIKHSTLSVWSDSPYTGVAEGDVFFTNGLRLRIREELDFLEGIITRYPVVRPTDMRRLITTLNKENSCPKLIEPLPMSQEALLGRETTAKLFASKGEKKLKFFPNTIVKFFDL